MINILAFIGGCVVAFFVLTVGLVLGFFVWDYISWKLENRRLKRNTAYSATAGFVPFLMAILLFGWISQWWDPK